MSNVNITARWNEGKGEMPVSVTDNATPWPTVNFNRMSCGFKTADDVNQVAAINALNSALDKVRENMSLVTENAGSNHVLAYSVIGSGEVSAEVVSSGDIFTPLPDDCAYISIGLATGWAQAGATIEMDTIGKRMQEVLLEKVLRLA